MPLFWVGFELTLNYLIKRMNMCGSAIDLPGGNVFYMHYEDLPCTTPIAILLQDLVQKLSMAMCWQRYYSCCC